MYLEDTVLNLGLVRSRVYALLFLLQRQRFGQACVGAGDKIIASEKRPSILAVCGNSYLTVCSGKWELQPVTQQPREGENQPAALAALPRSPANPVRPRFLIKQGIT